MMTRRLDIQGLRAVAVLAVLFFHAFPEGWLKGGYIGVDIFFVISGFLITLVIRSSYIEGRFSLVDFYRRRARRLLPALFVVVLSTLAAGAVFLSPNGYLQLGKSVIPALGFVSNFYFSNNVDYFDADAEKQPLLHTWSLSVEEQFYLIYPLVLVAILRRGERSWPVSMMAVTVLSTMVLSEALVRYDPSWSYFASPARAFELLIGCSAALLSTRFSLPSLQANLLSAGGAALMVGSLLLIGRESAFPGLLAALPCLGTAAILLAGANNRPVASRILANPLLVMVGNVSYSMYLWHWPILALARSNFGLILPSPVAWGAIGLTAVLSYLSFRWIEQPFLKRDAGGWPIFRLAAGSAAALAIFAIAVKLTGGNHSASLPKQMPCLPPLKIAVPFANGAAPRPGDRFRPRRTASSARRHHRPRCGATATAWRWPMHWANTPRSSATVSCRSPSSAVRPFRASNSRAGLCAARTMLPRSPMSWLRRTCARWCFTPICRTSVTATGQA